MKTFWAFGICVVLVGCAGGGGGGGGSSVYFRSSVPYHTPVRVTTIDPLLNNTVDRAPAGMGLFVADLTGTGVDNVVVAGRQLAGSSHSFHQSRISVLGWSDRGFVNQTSQWFAGISNVIKGTEPSVKFADFNADGRLDMFVSNGTDGLATVTSSQVFFNEGDRFRRHELDYLAAINAQPRPPGTDSTWVPIQNTWHHDSQIVDINQDGRPDIFTAGYQYPIVSFNNGDGTFTNKPFHNNASSMVGADFLNNGTITFLGVDNGWPGYNGRPRLFSWRLGDQGQFELENLIYEAGPLPRFSLPKWDNHGFDERRNHEARVLANDWDGDGVMDAIVISRPWPGPGQNWNRYSEVQFLKNDGHGHFSDATDQVLIGYNTDAMPDYNPQFVDINGDGLMDIFLSGGAHDRHDAGQFLIRTQDGKYVASHAGVISDFSKQTTTMMGDGSSIQNVRVVRGPNDQMYLVGNTANWSTSAQNIYIARLGGNIVTTEQAVSTIRARWPWMSAPQVNEMLARTQATYLDGTLTDLDRIRQPVGGIGITVQGQNVWQAISGYIAGVRLDSPMVRVTDTLGRDFSVNLSSMNSLDAGIWSRTWFGTGQATMNSQGENLISAGSYDVGGLRIATDTRNYSVGTPQLKLSKHWSVNAQYTNLPFNPWLQLSGVWGNIIDSQMLESVVTYRDRWFQAQAGVMNVGSSLSPGLVSKVSSITSVWYEMGYRESKFGLFAGIRPVVVAGHVEANLPTGVDWQGNLQYTKTKMEITSPTLMYARAYYGDNLGKDLKYHLSGMYLENGQYRAMAEFTYSY